jgi:hypothetical protein
MLQPTLTRRVEDALQALKLADALTKVLDSLESLHITIDKYLLGVAEGGGNKIIENANAIHSHIASLPSITRHLSARKLFREVEILEAQLSVALTKGVKERQYIVKFLEQLDEFAEAYNAYVADQAGTNGYPLLLVARRLRHSLSDLRGILEYLRANSSGIISGHADEAELSLVVQNVSGLIDFASKITALDALYSELCYVLGVSVASHPLRIGKIESGSLWTRLFGDTRTIGLMISLIEGSVRFLHRNYTTEGRFAAIPKKLESLNAILDFSNRLKESGVDVGTLEASLAKNAVSITNSLNTLVSGQSVVELNGQVFSVGTEVNRALLEQTGTPKLTFEPPMDSTPRPNPPTDGGSEV